MSTKLEASRGMLEATPKRWVSLVESVPDDVLRRPPLPGEWSAVECLRHLLEADRDLLVVRLDHFLEGRAELIPYDPATASEPGPVESTAELLAAFVALRDETVRKLNTLSDDDLSRTAFHPEFGVAITLGQLLSHWAAHDLLHIVQAEEALMQVFIPDTTVWRYEFAGRDVARV